MAFEPAVTKIPVSIPSIVVRLCDGDPVQRVDYHMEILYNDSSVKHRSGNLVPHLTAQQITALQNFMAYIRTLAESEILPQE